MLGGATITLLDSRRKKENYLDRTLVLTQSLETDILLSFKRSSLFLSPSHTPFFFLYKHSNHTFYTFLSPTNILPYIYIYLCKWRILESMVNQDQNCTKLDIFYLQMWYYIQLSQNVKKENQKITTTHWNIMSSAQKEREVEWLISNPKRRDLVFVIQHF